MNIATLNFVHTVQKMKFAINDFFSKCDQIHRKLRFPVQCQISRKFIWILFFKLYKLFVSIPDLCLCQYQAFVCVNTRPLFVSIPDLCLCQYQTFVCVNTRLLFNLSDQNKLSNVVLFIIFIEHFGIFKLKTVTKINKIVSQNLTLVASVDVTKSAGNYRFGHIYWINL